MEFCSCVQWLEEMLLWWHTISVGKWHGVAGFSYFFTVIRHSILNALSETGLLSLEIIARGKTLTQNLTTTKKGVRNTKIKDITTIFHKYFPWKNLTLKTVPWTRTFLFCFFFCLFDIMQLFLYVIHNLVILYISFTYVYAFSYSSFFNVFFFICWTVFIWTNNNTNW